MELNIKSVPCTSSILIQQVHKYREEPQVESITTTKAQKFTIVHPDGKSINYLWKSTNFCEQLKKLFLEKKYDHDVFVVVDKNEIFVDFTKKDYCPPLQSVLEYRIIEKQLLIQIQFQFRSQVSEYLTTPKANFPVIIYHFIDDNHLKSLSLDIILCFFDEYGKCINDGNITDTCKIITILVTEETSNTNNLCEIILRYKDQNQTNLFHSTTKWQQIDLWLKTFLQEIDPPVDNYAFLLQEQKTIIDDNQSISSVLDQTKSVTIDIINRNITTKVIFSYETNNQSVYTLKSIKISSLFNNKNLLQQLNLSDISPDDCVLMVGETNEHILTKDDLQQPVGTYSTTENEFIHFRISISIQIMKYDDKERIKISLSNRNTTIKQLLELTEKSTDIYKYLALNDTKRILNSNELISNLNKTKFILVKENETCLISIEKDVQHQRFTIFATIADIIKEYQIDISHKNLLYSNDFVPSTDTQLLSLQLESPIRFIVIDGNLPAMVTIQNSIEHKSIKFNCSLSMTIKRLCAIACQLFGVNNDYYRLTFDDMTLDDDISLEDINSNATEFQFQMISTASIHCSIRCSERTFILPCQEDTSALTIVKESLEKLHIPLEDIDMYELIALTDDQTSIDFDLSMRDIQQLFPSDSTTISFELKKKNE